MPLILPKINLVLSKMTHIPNEASSLHFHKDMQQKIIKQNDQSLFKLALDQTWVAATF